MPTPSIDAWVPVDAETASTITRAIVYVLTLLLAFLAALAFRGAVRNALRRTDTAARRLFRRPEPPTPWATGEWACSRCRSVNRGSSRACERCRSPRAEADMALSPVATAPDILPVSVPVGAGSVVTLEHNALAHADGLNGHWRLRVNSVIVGSAARRDGALALLRAVEGVDTVLFDPKGDGYAPYPLAAVIAAFERPRLPIRAPCPEAGR